jgi:putative ABC transport system ATP-binding protein
MKTRSRHDPTVSIRGLNFSFGQAENRRQVLVENHLDLHPGEIVTLTGPSGSGKTTLLTLIGALRGVQEGRVTCLGRELRGLPPMDLVAFRRQVGFIFQAHNLFDSLTAMENVNLAIELGDVAAAERDLRSAAILKKVGLGDRLKHKPQALSGGQRQRVAIARALVNRPKLILADEPTAALDQQSGHEIMLLLRELAEKNGSTVLLVTHDSRVLDIADRLVHMVDGRRDADSAL